MRKAYRAILWLYPANYREIFGAEMMETFQRAAVDSRSAGSSTFRRFAVREFGGLLRGLCREWIARWAAHDSYMTARCELSTDSNLPTDLAVLQNRLRHVLDCMEFAIAHHDFPRARRCSDEERVMSADLDRAMAEYKLNEPVVPPPCSQS